MDSECIYGEGSYVEIAERMLMLAGTALSITNLRDHVGDEIAWLSFTQGSREHRWEFELNRDWVDTTIFSHFVRLLDSQATGRHFTYHDLCGQDFLLDCATAAVLEILNRLPDLKFEWLT